MVAQSVDSRIGSRRSVGVYAAEEKGLPGSVKAETQQEQDKI